MEWKNTKTINALTISRNKKMWNYTIREHIVYKGILTQKGQH